MTERIMRCRDRVEGDLVALTPLHVGALGVSTDADLPQARDGLGRLVIPGTALAGALRAALGEQEGTDPRVSRSDIWGGALRPGGPLVASRVTIADAPETEEQETSRYGISVRQHVSIDRDTAVAADGHLFTREVVAVGTRFRFALVVESVDDDERDKAEVWLERLLRRLQSIGVAVGGGTSVGLGWVRLADSWHWWRDDFTTAKGLIDTVVGVATEAPPAAALHEQGEAAVIQSSCSLSESDVPPRCLRVRVRWRPVGPLLSKDATDGLMADWFPLAVPDPVSQENDDPPYRLLLPGSSVKGSLRTRAEYIGRVVTGCTDVGPQDAGFVAQMAATESLPGVWALFGSAGDRKSGRQGNKGALTVRDTLTRAVIDPGAWRKVRFAPKRASDTAAQHNETYAFAKDVDRLNEIVKPEGLWFDLAVRNSIDRWSGSVVQGALFAGIEPYAIARAPGEPGAWGDLVLDVDLQQLWNNAQYDEVAFWAALSLLVFTLRDLCEGWIPLGFGVTRGLGAIEVAASDIVFTVADDPTATWPADVAGLNGISLNDLLFTKDRPGLTDLLNDAWVKTLREEER